MTWLIIALAGATMLILATLMAYVLGWANKTFHVEVDPRMASPGGAKARTAKIGRLTDELAAFLQRAAKTDRVPKAVSKLAERYLEDVLEEVQP